MGPTQPDIQWVQGVVSTGRGINRGMKLTIRLHLVRRSRKVELYLLSPLCLHGWLFGWCIPVAPTWSIGHPLQFLNLRHSVGLLGRVISPSQGRYLRQTSIPRVGLEPTIPAFERAKTVRALNLAATVIGVSSWHSA
jgi:hypothetical protein